MANEKLGTCAVCGKGGHMSSCEICGSTVCNMCFDPGAGICKPCKKGRSMGDAP